MHFLFVASLVLTWPAPAIQDTIPFELVRNQILMPVVMDAGDTLTMLLDTGVSPSAVDLSLARRQGWASDEPTGFAAGAGSDSSVPLYPSRITGVRVGRTRLTDHRALAMDLEPIADRLGGPLHGILGYGFLDGRRVRIDYARRIVIVNGGGPQPSELLFQTEMVLPMGDGMPLVHVQVNGTSLPVTLDTGSSLTLELFPAGATAAHVARIDGGDVNLAGARGAFTSGTGRASSIALGNARLDDQEIVLSEARGGTMRMGNLGNGFLQHFVLTLDYRAKRVYLEVAAEAQDDRAPTNMFHGGPAHGGRLATRAVTRPGMIRWELQTHGPVRSSPVVLGSSVYVGSDDGGLYAVDLETGATEWRFDAGHPIRSAPAVNSTMVFVTDHRGAIYGLGRHDGAVRWSVDVGPTLPMVWGLEGWDYVGSSPALADTLLVAGAGDGIIRAVHTQRGEVLWEVATGSRIRSSPAIHDGRVYVGSADGFLRVLELTTGRAIWRFETRGANLNSEEFGFDRRTISGGATVSGNHVIVGSRDAHLYALNFLGEEIWANNDESSAWIISTPAVSGSLIVIGRSSSTKVQAYDLATGTIVWDTKLDGPVYGSPALVDQLVYVTTGGTNAKLVALDLASGAIQWQRRLGAASWASPTVSGGVVIVGSDDGRVTAIEDAADLPPYLAVFQDSTLRSRSIFSTLRRDTAIAPFLQDRGFDVLDAEALVAFLQARVTDRAPSVVVMAIDVFPEAAVPNMVLDGLVLNYLTTGGKIVWVGNPPYWAMNPPDMRGFTLSVARPTRFLGVDHSGYVTDARMHRATELGRTWGLPGWWTGPGGVEATDVTTVLATDEEGRASVWIKSFGGPVGTGWVAFPHQPDPAWLASLARLAEIGVSRRGVGHHP